MSLYQIQMETWLGDIRLMASDNGLAGLVLPTESHGEGKGDFDHCDPGGVLQAARAQLTEYFAGLRREFDLPLDVRGTEFQQSVWQELRQIPYGETCSYAEIARRIGSQRAVRAVGGANGRNPIPIIIPCHRVISSDGGLGGYSGGVRFKQMLLHREGARIPNVFGSQIEAIVGH